MRPLPPPASHHISPTPSPRAQESWLAQHWPVLGLAGFGAALLLIAALLWSRYGTAVFFDVLNAGLAACL